MSLLFVFNNRIMCSYSTIVVKIVIKIFNRPWIFVRIHIFTNLTVRNGISIYFTY